MIDLSPIEETQCMLHAKRLVDAWLEDPRSAHGWCCVVAQCKAYHDSTHCWLEHGDKVFDLTRSMKPRDRNRHYRRVGVIKSARFDAPTLLKEIWEAQWASTGTHEVMETVLNPLDGWIFRKYFGDHDCDNMFPYAEAASAAPNIRLIHLLSISYVEVTRIKERTRRSCRMSLRCTCEPRGAKPLSPDSRARC
jgi:hypothetical protein